MISESDFAKAVLVDMGLELGRCGHADGSILLSCRGKVDMRKCPTCGAVWQETCDSWED